MIVMKWNRLLVLLISLAVLGSAYPVYAETPDGKPPVLTSDAAVLIDAKSGMVLYAHNADKQEFPASITKIITGIIAIEDEQVLTSLVKVSKEARNEQGTRIYLAEDEQVPLINLLYGMLMNSGNDAATAIAEYVDGSKAQFAQRMNAFVQEKVGVTNSHFVNPSGLPDPQQYTTAMDMALISRYAMKNDLFRSIVGTKRMPWNGKEWQSALVNHNEMLNSYEGATGIKNGYTSEAGFTLVTSAKRGDMELIGVVLKSPTKQVLYREMTKLLDYGFEHFEEQRFSMANQCYPLRCEWAGDFLQGGPFYAIVPKGENPAISVTADGEVKVQTSLGSETVGKLQLAVPSLSTVTRHSPERAADARGVTTSGERVREPQSKKVQIFIIWGGLLLYLTLVSVIRFRRQRTESQRDASFSDNQP